MNVAFTNEISNSSSISSFKSQEPINYSSNCNLKVLLLQGPAGPFFKQLDIALSNNGFNTHKILFNAADKFFCYNKNYTKYSGDLVSWVRWLHRYFDTQRPDIVVLFGSSRPAHIKARELAKKYNITVISLEEGYLRSGYISCETSGNNQFSPLANWQPVQRDCSAPESLNIKSSFFSKCFWAMLYYGIREMRARDRSEIVSHRLLKRLDVESAAWIGHFFYSLVSRFVNRNTIKKLQSHDKNGYLIVPLQTPTDSQIRHASKGWNNEKLILDCLKARKVSASNELIVFKTHPLDENSRKLKRFIVCEAQKTGLEQYVRVISSGKLSELVSSSAGMIVINSTATFSALHHNKPILVLGDAIFRHTSIVTLGEGYNDIVKFMEKRTPKCAESIKLFIKDVKSSALVPGDFYLKSTAKITADNITRKIILLMNMSRMKSEK